MRDETNGKEFALVVHFLLDRDTVGVYYRKALSQLDIIF